MTVELQVFPIFAAECLKVRLSLLQAWFIEQFNMSPVIY